MRWIIAPTLGPTEKFGWEVQVDEGTHVTTHRGFAATHAKALQAVKELVGERPPRGYPRDDRGGAQLSPTDYP